ERLTKDVRLELQQGDPARLDEDGGVVDEHVHVDAVGAQLACARLDALVAGDVELAKGDAELVGGGAPELRVARGEDHVQTQRGQATGGLEPDATVGARDEGRPAL